MKKIVLLVAAGVCCCSIALAKNAFPGANIKDSAFAKADIEHLKKIESLIPDKAGIGPTINDRDYWNKLKAECPKNVAKILKYANAKAFPDANAKNTDWGFASLPTDKDMQSLSWLYDMKRKSSDKYAGESFRILDQRWHCFRKDHLQHMVVAECIENKGRFLPHIKATIELLCALDHWINARHYKIFKGCNVVSLSSEKVAANFSISIYMLADKLPGALRKKAKTAVRRFIINPFMNAVELDVAGKHARNALTSGAHWLKWKINWNPVCLSGVTICAVMTLDDKRERAVILAAVEKYMTDYQGVLLDDGYYTEGINYCVYGLDPHVAYAELLYRYSRGRINHYLDAFFKKMSTFPYISMIQKNLWVTFADAMLYHPPNAPFSFMMLYKRLKIQEYKHMNKFCYTFPWYTGVIYSVLCDVDDLKDSGVTTIIEPEPTLRHWFRDVKLLISRDYPDAVKPFSGTIKGSVAARRHTHSDSGSFAVACDGKWLLCDPGYPVNHSKQHWTVDCGSYYHSVPLVDGEAQKDYNHITSKGIKVLEKQFSDDCDMVKYDLRYAYMNRSRLKELSRLFSHNRKNRTIQVVDTVEFKDAPGGFESALITFSKVEKINEHTLKISEDNRVIKLDVAANVPLEIKINTQAKIISKYQQKKYYKTKKILPVTRIEIKCKDKVKQAKITIKITPENSVL